MELLNQATSGFSWRLHSLPDDVRTFVETLEKIERLYEGYNIQNKIIDGTESFSICGVQGVTIEFRYVHRRNHTTSALINEDVEMLRLGIQRVTMLLWRTCPL